jgi:hypothetical protein
MTLPMLPKQVIGPLDVFNKQAQALRLCSQTTTLQKTFAPKSEKYVPSAMDVASVYATADFACDNSRQVSMQVGEVSGDSMTMYVNMATHTVNGVSTSAQKFVAARNDRSLVFTHQPSAFDYRNDDAPFMAAFEGEMSADGDSIVLRKVGSCGDITVSRPAMKVIRGGAQRRFPVQSVAAGAACLVAIVVASALVVRRRRAAQAQAELLEATA